MRSALRTLFLDAGGVLVCPNWERVAATLQRHGVGVDPSTLAAAEPQAKEQYDAALGSGRPLEARPGGWVYLDLVLSAAGVPLTSEVDEAFRELREYDARWNIWERVPADAPDALARFRACGLTVVVVSNSTGTLRQLLDRVGLLPLVDVVVDSAEEGVEKPDPRLFRIALSRSGAGAGSTLHAGDIYHVDVVGARAAGLRAVLIDPGGTSRYDDCPRVRSLSELADRVEDGSLD